MRRTNNLLASIADPDNLRLAFWKAQKGKIHSQEVMNYREDLDDNLMELRDEILSGEVRVGNYRYFKIYDPKERQICASAFREQVLHHALMNICHEYFERVQIYDSYASRPGKGVHAALRRAAAFNRLERWFLKLDMKKFFDSLHHETLKQQLERLFKDYRLLAIFEQIIDSYKVLPGRGVPIGNLSSQYFANHYLAGLDHYIKEHLRCSAYVRYMDDLLLWHHDKEWVKAAKHRIEAYVVTKLDLQLKPPLLNHNSRGLPFCGYFLHRHHIRLSQRSKKRYIRKLRELNSKYQSGEWDESTCQRRVLPLIAFTEHADAVWFRQQILRSISE